MKFRKRPVVIDADLFTAEMFHQPDQWPKGVVYGFTPGNEEGGPIIETLEGHMRVSVGDWIITGVNGEKYPCKPDIFLKTYERVL